MFNKILIATGLSTNARPLFSHVRFPARRFNSEVHLLGTSTEPQQVRYNTLTSYLNIRPHCLKTIMKYTKPNNFDLTATATRYSNRIGDRLFGNTTKKAIEKSGVLVFTMGYPAFKALSTKGSDEAGIQDGTRNALLIRKSKKS